MTAARTTPATRTTTPRTTLSAGSTATCGAGPSRRPRRHDGDHGRGRPGAERRPRVRVRVAEDLDMATAPRLAERVLDLVRCGALVVVDTSAVGFVDCCGLAALERCVVEGGGAVRLEPVGGAVQRLRALVALTAAPTTARVPVAVPLHDGRARRR